LFGPIGKGRARRRDRVPKIFAGSPAKVGQRAIVTTGREDPAIFTSDKLSTYEKLVGLLHGQAGLRLPHEVTIA